MSQDPDFIEQALREAFLAALPGVDGNTAFENVAFDPTGRAKWYAFHYLPGEPIVATLGAGGQDKFTGIVQIDINIPNGKGKGDSGDDIKLLRDYFTAGKRLLANTVSVCVVSAGRSGKGSQVGQNYRFSFTIYWESRVTR